MSLKQEDRDLGGGCDQFLSLVYIVSRFLGRPKCLQRSHIIFPTCMFFLSFKSNLLLVQFELTYGVNWIAQSR